MPSQPARDDRFHSVQETDQRTPYQRDRDRVLYSRNLRRLSGVTQVARSGESYLYHNRLGHSLKVAQVARRLAEYSIRENEDTFNIRDHVNPDVVEAAALAHDLGHPPFGHVVEKKLDELVRDRGVDEGFEGNPQSFRIVTSLASNAKRYDGLNLTRATLNATLKYPWKRGEQGKSEKWGYYDSEEDYFEFAREGSKPRSRSLEAEIMDWADDITYGIHDVTDFYQSGLIPLDQLLEGTNERELFIDNLYSNSSVSPSDIDAVEFFEDLEDWYSGDELLTPFGGTDAERRSLKEFSSALIQKYLGISLDDVRIRQTPDGPTLHIEDRWEAEVELLKYLSIYYVIEDSTLMAQQHGQREMVTYLFNALMDFANEDTRFSSIIPSPYRERLDGLGDTEEDRLQVRVVCDMISSLTEKQASRLFNRMTGHSERSLQDRIVR